MASTGAVATETNRCPRCQKEDTTGVVYDDFKSCLECLGKIINEYHYYVGRFGDYENLTNERDIVCNCEDLWRGCQCGAFLNEQKRRNHD